MSSSALQDPQKKSLNLASPDSKTIQNFFDSIAFRYDFLNSFLSLRLDERWREKSLKLLMEGREESLLDLGTGTGKFLELALKIKKWKRTVGLDFSQGMLQVAKRSLGEGTGLVSGDFHFLPFQNKTFDLVISSFTLRSVKQMPQFLSEVFRLLKPNGKAGFLCLTRPTNFWWNIIYYPYLNLYLPLIGWLFSGNGDAYQFLSKSIQTFQEPEKTAVMMKEAGFREVEIRRFTMGSATLIMGKK